MIQQLALVPSQLKLRVVPPLPCVKVGIMWAVRLRSTGSLGLPRLNLGLTIGLACIITTGWVYLLDGVQLRFLVCGKTCQGLQYN